MGVVVIGILIFNVIILPISFYALITHQYFSMVCRRQKVNRTELKTENSLPEGYNTIGIDGEPGRLQGYYFKQGGKKLVILVHGWRDSALSRLEAAGFYQRLGYDVFIPDLHGHGGSSGKYMGMGITDGQDLADWVSYFKKELGEHTEIIMDGISTGAAAVLQMDADFINHKVSAIIADSSYENPRQLLDKMLPITPKFMTRIYYPGIDFWCRQLGKFHMKNSNTVEGIRNIKVPVLLIGGALDTIVPFHTQNKLKAACGGSCTLWILEGAAHAKASYVDKPAYEAVIGQFLKS